jgi:hypothetical protein
MKWLIDFTKTWKHRNILHLVGGCLISLLPNILLPNILGLLIGCLLCFLVGHQWEVEQVKSFKAIYSKSDILLTILGGLILGILTKL